MYMCEDMFKDLDITLPLSYFECDVLTEMNVVPTQLYLNSWAFMKAFSTLGPYLNISPVVNKFLYFCWVKASEDGKVGWVSMICAKGSLFTLFNSSGNNFKTCFFKNRPNHIYPDPKNII